MTLRQRYPLVLICGGSSSGKTLIAAKLRDALGTATPVSMDDYYKDLSSVPPDSLLNYDFDHPDALDEKSFLRDLALLADGKPVPRLRYDFATHARTVGSDRLSPVGPLLVEGIFAFHFEEIRRLASLKVFVHCEESLMLRRRVTRDTAERKLDEAFIRRQFDATVLPAHRRLVAPARIYADMIVDGTVDASASAAEIASRLSQTIICNKFSNDIN